MRAAGPAIFGVDFTSAPRRAKAITVAHVVPLVADRCRLVGVEELRDWSSFEAFLRRRGPWVAGFDLPFGLPRALVEALGWPTAWRASIAHYAAFDRAALRDLFAAFCDARPVGAKFAHRATDGPAGSSSSMKWVNPPVAWMLHAGVPRLIAAGVSIPGLDDDPARVDATRVALEAYPGYLAAFDHARVVQVGHARAAHARATRDAAHDRRRADHGPSPARHRRRDRRSAARAADRRRQRRSARRVAVRRAGRLGIAAARGRPPALRIARRDRSARGMDRRCASAAGGRLPLKACR